MGWLLSARSVVKCLHGCVGLADVLGVLEAKLPCRAAWTIRPVSQLIVEVIWRGRSGAPVFKGAVAVGRVESQPGGGCVRFRFFISVWSQRMLTCVS